MTPILAKKKREYLDHSSRFGSLFFRNALSAFLPFRALEQLRAHLNQTGQHFENGYRSPLLTLPRSESATVNFVCNVRVGAFLNDKFHQLQQSLPFCWILF